jgi:hypothetical protein
MSDEELECFCRWIPHSGKILEFGMGGSTRRFLESGIARLDSVESDPAWLSAMAKETFFKFFIRKKRLFPHYANIGPTRQHGLPCGSPNLTWLRYHRQAWTDIDAKSLDLVFIDGRFRLACACQTLLRCPQRPPIMIHDFSNRRQYHAILEYTDILDSAETMIVLKQKSDADFRKLGLLLQETQLYPE